MQILALPYFNFGNIHAIAIYTPKVTIKKSIIQQYWECLLNVAPKIVV